MSILSLKAEGSRRRKEHGMRGFKLLVTLAGLAGALLGSSAKVEAMSGCCRLDCKNAYCTMVANGVPGAGDWLTECIADCDAHGTADPSYCPEPSCPVT